MLEPFDKHGQMDIDACMDSFWPYLKANCRTTNTVFHASLNPSPEDRLTDDGYRIGTPVKSNIIGKDVGYKALQKYYDNSKIKLKEDENLARLRQTVKDAMSPHNTRDEFRQLLKAGNIDTFLPINPVGRIYSATFIDHIAGIVANDPVLRKEFSANVFNELYLVCKEERTIAGQPSEQKHEQRNHTANPVSRIVDTVLDLADTQAYEEQQRQIQRRKKRRLQ